MKLKGIIFDMDGVLLDTERVYFQCWKQSAQDFGFSMADETALAVRSCCQTYAEPFLKRVMGEDFDYLAVRNHRRKLVSAYLAEHGISQKPGIRPLLDYCRENGLIAAVATATARSLAEERLESAGLGGLFPHIVGGNQVKTGKPEPEIYRIAAAQLGLEPEACAAVEDSPNGIIAAFSAGCRPLMVPDLTQPDASLQLLLAGTAPDLEQLIPVIQHLEEGEFCHA